MINNERKPRVAYLFGAGASQACLDAINSASKTLMRHITPTLIAKLRIRVTSEYDCATFRQLLNTLGEDADFEHIISFLDGTPSHTHRQLAAAVRHDFETVLKEALDQGQKELLESKRSLYAAVIDMYNVADCPEQLAGMITINYDQYIEDAAQLCGRPIDLCVDLGAAPPNGGGLPLIKLHGSFGWRDSWPIEQASGHMPLWIPPGIHKDKARYPFNVLWGRGREVLNCDVLRVVGCRLAANDWDLISLLFGTRYGDLGGRTAYRIEVINSPRNAFQLQQAYPYLEIKSMVEHSMLDVAEEMVGELLQTKARAYDGSTDSDRMKSLGSRNWLELWLVHVAEAFMREELIGSVDTEAGIFAKILEHDEE